MAFTFAPADRVEDLLEHYANLGPELQRLGIDPLACRERTLAQCCAQIGRDPDEAIIDLAMTAAMTTYADDHDWTDATIAEVIDHISHCHHRYLRAELPRLGRLVDAIAGPRPYPEAAELRLGWHAMADRLLAHLDSEEQRLFPACIAIEHAVSFACLPDTGIVATAFHDLVFRHESSEAELAHLLDLAGRTRTAPDRMACRPPLVAGMCALRADLLVHDREEEDILLPAVLDLQNVIAGRLTKVPIGLDYL